MNKTDIIKEVCKEKGIEVINLPMVTDDEEFIPGECKCIKCGLVATDEDDEDDNFVGCVECGQMVCEKCVVNVEHQGYQESLCPRCAPSGSKKKERRLPSLSAMKQSNKRWSKSIANSDQPEK